MSKRNANTKFKPGNKFGKGGYYIPEDIKHARKHTREDLERVTNKLLAMPLKNLGEYCKEDITVLEGLIASVLAKAIHQGDALRLDFILGILRLKPKPDESGNEKPNFHKQAVEFINQIEQKNGEKIEPKD